MDGAVLVVGNFLAFLSDPVVVRRILRHLRLPDTPPALAGVRVFFRPDLVLRWARHRVGEHFFVFMSERGKIVGEISAAMSRKGRITILVLFSKRTSHHLSGYQAS